MHKVIATCFCKCYLKKVHFLISVDDVEDWRHETRDRRETASVMKMNNDDASDKMEIDDLPPPTTLQLETEYDSVITAKRKRKRQSTLLEEK